MGRLLFFLLVVGAVCFGAAFSYYNVAPVTFHYLAGQVEMPLIWLLIGAFLAGAAAMWLLDLARLFALSRESRRQQRQIAQLDAELKSLRALPLAQTSGAQPPAKDA